MPKKMSLAVLTVLLSGMSAFAEETTETKKYVIPEDVDCIVRKEDRITVCTDKTGQKITGVLMKYAENTLIRTYPLKDGILQGTAVAYYISGGMMWEKPYIDGKLDGTVKRYYKNGGLESAEPYKNGKKEGVAKYYYENGVMQGQGAYISGNLNGPVRFYTDKGELKAEFSCENNAYVSGFSYQNVTDSSGNKKTDSDGNAVTQKHIFTENEIQQLNRGNNKNTIFQIESNSTL